MAAISGDLSVSAALLPYPNTSRRCLFPPSKVDYTISINGESSHKWSRQYLDPKTMRCHYTRPLKAIQENNTSSKSINQDVDNLLLNAINMSFLERLNLAWKILFPSAITRRKSNANIAKQRLKMILFSDRCAVSDEAKQKIVQNIVNVLSDFVEIESQDKVQLSVSTDRAIGTIYSVIVPVRRVKTEYLEEDEEGTIMNVEYRDNGEKSGAVDVTFDFYVPDEKI